MTGVQTCALPISGPSVPSVVLGLNGAPQAGEKFRVYEDEAEAKEIANRRAQILREQGIRTKKHITLDEIGRRLALGSFKELKVIIKGDVDGSVEALSDSLQKLSTEEIVVKVIHKAVGAITESDVTLANASDAIIIGFNVRADSGSRKLIDERGIDLHYYSIIYEAIDEIKKSLKGMLEPEFREQIVGNAEVRDVFRHPKFGAIAGCMVTEGFVKRNLPIRVLRDNVVIFEGQLDSLRRFKDDAAEVKAGMECGMGVKNYNEIKVGDQIEVFEKVQVAH